MAEAKYRGGALIHLQPLSDVVRRRSHLNPEGLVRPAPRVRDVRVVRVAVLRERQIFEARGIQLEHLMLPYFVPESLTGRDQPFTGQQLQTSAHSVPGRLELGLEVVLRGQAGPRRVRTAHDVAAKGIGHLVVLRLLAHDSIMTHSVNLLVHVVPHLLTSHAPSVQHHYISLYQQVEQVDQRA